MKLGLWYDNTKDVIYAIRSTNKWEIRNRVDVTEAAIRFIIKYGLNMFKKEWTLWLTVEWSDYMVLIARKPLIHNEDENE